MIAPRPGQDIRQGIRLGYLEDVVIQDITWLDRGFLPAAELTILQGHGDTNKGTLACHWAGMVSRGEGEAQDGPGYVLMAAGEDNIATVLKPRLLATDADISLVHTITFARDGIQDAVLIPDDIPELRDAIEQLQAKLLVIDPLMTHLSDGVDSHTDHSVKRALKPLSEMANETGCAVLGVHHFTKDTSKGSLLSGMASGAFTNTARCVLAMARDDEDEELRVCEVVKLNIGKYRGMKRNVRIRSVKVEGLLETVPAASFDGAATKTVNELLDSKFAPLTGKKAEDCRELILRSLKEGPKDMAVLKAYCSSEAGASGDTTWRAANKLKGEGRVVCANSGRGTPWIWRLTPGLTSDGSLGTNKVRSQDEDIPFEVLSSGY